MSSPAGERSIGVLIVDDQALVRAGFRMILEIEPDLHVVGEAADGEDGAAQVGGSAPGRRADGRPDARRGRHRGDARASSPTGRAVPRGHADHVRHGRVRLPARCEAGASGFLLKDVQPELLVAGIRAVHARRVAAGADRDPAA